MITLTQDLDRKVFRCQTHPGQEMPTVADIVVLSDGQDRNLLEDVLGQVIVSHDGTDVGQKLDPFPQQEDHERFLVDRKGPPPDGSLLYPTAPRGLYSGLARIRQNPGGPCP